MEGSLVAKDHLVSVDGYGRPIGSTLGYEVHCETCQIRFIAISILRKFAKLWRDRSRSTFVRSCQLPLVQEHCQCSLRTQARLNVKDPTQDKKHQARYSRRSWLPQKPVPRHSVQHIEVIAKAKPGVWKVKFKEIDLPSAPTV